MTTRWTARGMRWSRCLHVVDGRGSGRAAPQQLLRSSHMALATIIMAPIKQLLAAIVNEDQTMSRIIMLRFIRAALSSGCAPSHVLVMSRTRISSLSPTLVQNSRARRENPEMRRSGLTMGCCNTHAGTCRRTCGLRSRKPRRFSETASPGLDRMCVVRRWDGETFGS
jgi:hypothetical protein